MDTYKGLKMELDLLNKKRLIFSEFFILQNKIQTKFDKILGEITSKQFIILVMVDAFPYPPSLSEVAKHAGCSRQNIKKIAAVLENKGFVKMISDDETRATRIVICKKFYDAYSIYIEKSEIGLDLLFKGMHEDEINALFKGIHKIEKNIDEFIPK